MAEDGNAAFEKFNVATEESIKNRRRDPCRVYVVNAGVSGRYRKNAPKRMFFRIFYIEAG